MRDATSEAMRMFLGGRRYSEENLERDYLAEVARYSDDRWEAPQRAARLAAAVKRYKTSAMLTFIFSTVAHDPDPDLTPLAVKRLCKALFGRTGSQGLIVEVFGEKGRQHSSRLPHVFSCSPSISDGASMRVRRIPGMPTPCSAFLTRIFLLSA